MNLIATCECGNLFEVEPRFAGGIVNCPDCGRAVQVPGLRDPLWRLLQLGALGALAVAAVVVHSYLGLGASVLAGLAGILVLWILSRAL